MTASWKAPTTIHEMQQEEQISDSNPENSNSLGHEQVPQDDFLEQMISALPAWAELSDSSFSHALNGNGGSANSLKLFSNSLMSSKLDEASPENLHYAGSYFDADSTVLASRIRQHQITGGGRSSPGVRPPLGALQLNAADLGVDDSLLLNSRALHRSSSAGCVSDVGGSLPFPLSLGQGDHHPDSPSDTHLVERSRDDIEGPCNSSMKGNAARLYNTFQTDGSSPSNTSQHFQGYGGQIPGMNQSPASTVPAKPRVRARRGQATDPHSIAERLRRERIAERMKALQELVPNANKTDKASMLDEIIDYVKFLQLQVKVLSVSRLGGAAAVAPLVADISAEKNVVMGRRSNSINSEQTATMPSTQDGVTLAENQVAKLMEEDMGSAMQYLQGKGLCLMPISLASAISTATCHSKNPPSTATTTNKSNSCSSGSSTAVLTSNTSPSLTVQSTFLNNGGDGGGDSVKEATSVPNSKP